MSYETIKLELAEGVATLTLNRPDAVNTINLALARELHDGAARVCDDRAVRAIVLRGAGRMFCAGGDLKSFAAQGAELPAHLREVTASLHGAISLLATADAPTLAVVQGSA